MSTIERRCTPSLSTDCPAAAGRPVAERIPTRDAVLREGLKIRRALPAKQRRMIGPWCFLDHFGPAELGSGGGLRVGPHPHTGLQTFTWPLAGEILHRDSLGYRQLIQPGQVNLLTAGRGISHSEESPPGHGPLLHGAQLWIALPGRHRQADPAFEHYPELPVLQRGGFRLTVLAGSLCGEKAPTRMLTPLVGADLTSEGPAGIELTLDPAFEYGALVLAGGARLGAEPLVPGALLYLGRGRDRLAVTSGSATRLLLLGGPPFGEEILIWWNFIGRDRKEISAAVAAWNAGDARFGAVRGYPGERLPAPLPPWDR
jgi:redox-sensitive bicupin YhaK (pirin superfamily)